ncbi:hypothetical protein LDENG_00125790, partial [Lucifuga dentata]
KRLLTRNEASAAAFLFAVDLVNSSCCVFNADFNSVTLVERRALLGGKSLNFWWLVTGCRSRLPFFASATAWLQSRQTGLSLTKVNKNAPIRNESCRFLASVAYSPPP